MKTIKQIADELGVSKPTVRKEIENLGFSDKLEIRGNKVFVSEEQENSIIASFVKNKSEKSENRKRKTVSDKSENFHLFSDLVSVLQEQLAVKDEQLAAKDIQIAELTATVKAQAESVQAAQLLHARTMQKQIEAPKRRQWFWQRKKEEE